LISIDPIWIGTHHISPTKMDYHGVVFVVVVIAIGLDGCGSAKPAEKPNFPDIMVAGYTNQAKPSQILGAVSQGANVLFWSFMELQGNEVTTKGLVQGSVTEEKIKPVHEGLVAANRADVLHILSIGGWGVQHNFSETCGVKQCNGTEYAASFRTWNDKLKSQISGFPGFAGLDWDIEGVDKIGSPSNNFTWADYQIILDMSKDLQQDFLVTMVPPQSYFNCAESHFDTSLEHAAEPNVTYTKAFLNAGQNTYTVLYALCPNCFDLVMVQIYEGFSVAGYDLYWEGNASQAPSKGSHQLMVEIIAKNMQCLTDGFTVDFGGYANLSKMNIVVPAEKVVIGLGNGWTETTSPWYKFPFFEPSAASEAWCELANRTRGFVYWDIADDENKSFAGELHRGMTNCQSDGVAV